MAKKEKNKKNKSVKKIVFDEMLPQNLLLIGDKDDDEKTIYISQPAYKEIHAFTKNKLTYESGGMLIGNIVEAFGKKNIIVRGFIEAKYCECTPTTLTFTHETWDYVHKEMEKTYENGQIIGWIHTHPSFGIFLSEYDRFIQDNFFKEDYQIAYVVDPIQKTEGFFKWVNGKVEKCNGFYVFDDNNVLIELGQEHEPQIQVKNEADNGNWSRILNYVLLAALVIVILVSVVRENNLSKRLEILENQQDNIVASANQSINILQQRIAQLEEQIAELKTVVSENKSRYEDAGETEAENIEAENIKETDTEEINTEETDAESNTEENANDSSGDGVASEEQPL